MAYTLTEDDVADLANVAVELAHMHGANFDTEAAVIRLGQAAQIDSLFLLEVRDLAQSIRLRIQVQRAGMSGLKPLTERLNEIKCDCAMVIGVADVVKEPSKSKRRPLARS